jgi:hydrogenase maturation protein HypF
VLDAIACLLGVCDERTYEGEPAIKLEAAANKGDAREVTLEPIIEKVDGAKVVNTSQLLVDILSAVRARVPRKHIAAAAQRAIAQGLASIAIDAASAKKIEVVGGSGGVFYNQAITAVVREMVEKAGLKFIQHELLPPGDGGVSVGQAVVAASTR